MTNNLFETQYDLTKKSKLREFYEAKKIWIYSIIFLIIFFVIYNMNLQSINFYITAISLFYLFMITINIYVTFKTSFNI